MRKFRTHSAKFLVLLFLTALIALGAFYLLHRRASNQSMPAPKTAVTFDGPTDTPKKETPNDTPNEAAKPLPPSLLIKVPFTTQAPTANWDELHNEACEEASAIMANAYFDGTPADQTLTVSLVEGEINKLTHWQDEHQGYHLDQTTAETSVMIEAMYGLKTKQLGLSESEIKQALAENKLVLISFNGRALHNPHYKQPGPIHHMMVITGWTEDGKFITNDPGTKFGKNYQYDYKTLFDAAADWDHSTNNVDDTKKFMITVSN